MNRLITNISNDKDKKESAIKRVKKSIFDLDQLRQKESSAFQDRIIHVVYYLFNLFGSGKKPLLLTKEEPDQLRMPDYVKVSNKRFYEIKNNINNNKDLNIMVVCLSGKTTKIDSKDAFDLIYKNFENR